MQDETPSVDSGTLHMEEYQDDAAIRQLALASTSKPIWWTNINAKTPEGKALIWRCNGDADFKLVDYPETPIRLSQWYVTKARKNDAETGEIVDLPRIVLIDTDGKTYECFSPILARDLAVLISLYPDMTTESPQCVIVKKVPLGGGRNMLRLMPDPSQTQRPGKKK